MCCRGDSARQAFLRDLSIKRGRGKRGVYFSKIFSVLKPGMVLLDVGCGTGHIIQDLGACVGGSSFVGLDVSSAMLEIANANTVGLSNVGFVEGDGFRLPFCDCVFDVVITRLADYSIKEACRVLGRGGYFFEYGLGPEADKEIVEFFPERIEKESFFFLENLMEWKREVCEPVVEAGLVVSSVEDYKEDECYGGEDELMDLIEMVPLVKNFDRKKDRKRIRGLAEKYVDEGGMKITWHYYIMVARKS